jgi:type I restriction enzyme S subunit
MAEIDAIDIEPYHLQMVRDVLAEHLPHKLVWAYGSRVKWNASHTSDLDCVVFGADDTALYNAKEAFDESEIPFNVQILSWETAPADFKDNIKQKYYILQTEHSWRKCKLGDVVEVKYGKDHKSLNDGMIPCFGSGGLMRKVEKSLYDQESILIPRKGSLNNILYQDSPFWTVDTMFWTKINKELVYPRFLFYQLSLINYLTLNVGSDVPSLTVPVVNEIKVGLPPLPEQKAIAEVLSSLDDKIDLLHRQNKTLEAMAETLFRHHFIDNAQDDWEEGKLGDFLDCYNGVSYKGVDLDNSGNALITLKSFNRDGSFSLNGFKEYTGKYKEQHIAEEKDLIVAHTDITQDATIIGNPVLVYKPEKYKKLLFTMDIVKVKSRFEWLSNEFLYFLMKTTEFKEHCLGYSNGSTVLHLSKKAIPEFEFSVPPKKIIKVFDLFFKDSISKIFSNTKQIHTLEKLRDTLLPKLISGTVRVQYEEVA